MASNILSVQISELNDGGIEALKLVGMDSKPSFLSSHNSVAAKPSRNVGIYVATIADQHPRTAETRTLLACPNGLDQFPVQPKSITAIK
jgi:hypothetical protein